MPIRRSVECLKPHLPAGKVQFVIEELGVKTKLTFAQVQTKFKEEDFRKTLESCVESFGPKFETDKTDDSIRIIFDEDAEMYWTCNFKRVGKQWLFVGIDWSGC